MVIKLAPESQILAVM